MKKYYQAIMFTERGIQYVSQIFKIEQEVKDWINNKKRGEFKYEHLAYIELNILTNNDNELIVVNGEIKYDYEWL